MRQITIGFSLFALVVSLGKPALAEKEGVPGRRVGGGTRWSEPRLKPAPTMQTKLAAVTFASRCRLPKELKIKAMYS